MGGEGRGWWGSTAYWGGGLRGGVSMCRSTDGCQTLAASLFCFVFKLKHIFSSLDLFKEITDQHSFIISLAKAKLWLN